MTKDVLIAEVKGYRTSNGYSQAEFAQLVGTTQQAVSRFETGKIDPSISWILNVLHVIGYDFILDKGD